ncbi:MAG: hypothetical protein Kow00109_15100 [Acidobacteriota bacterium]
MTPNIPLAVRDLINEYRSFLRTTFRFLDPHLRDQFDRHLEQADVVVKGPYVTLARDFALGHSLRQLVDAGDAHPGLLKAHGPFGENPLFFHEEQTQRTGRERAPNPSGRPPRPAVACRRVAHRPAGW